MQIALIQSDLIWEDKVANLTNLEKKIESSIADIFVLPEMFPTGFSMDPEPVAESMDGEIVAWMKRLASQKHAAICGSVIIKESGRFFNRFLFCKPDGEIAVYDKRHLFSLAGEDVVYERGTSKTIVEYNGWKICLQVCYDLRFPVFSRNTDDYDLLIYVANWPKPRISAWDILLAARAVENMCYVVGVNRVGSDPNGNTYPGHSKTINYLGETIAESQSDESVLVAKIDRDEMLRVRKKLNFLADRDSFTVT